MPRQIRKKFDEISSFGTGTDLLLPHIELNSNKEIKIEGCKGIIKYDTRNISLNCGEFIVKIEGNDLCLNNLSTGLFSVSGEILSLDFVSI